MRLEEHNLVQRRYFETTLKGNLVPADSPYLNRHVEEALRAAGSAAGGRVLEVGCGMGRYTLLLARRGIRVEGLDLSGLLLERLRDFDQGCHDIPLHEADVADLPEALAGGFDLVLGFFTLHHVHQLQRCFEGVARALRPGGRVVFLEPNALNPLFYVQILITPGMTWAGDGGILSMRRRKVFSAMEGAGFTELTLARFGFVPPFVANRGWGRRLEGVLESFPLWRSLLPFQVFAGLRP
jgi:SAM-dependent methyltransferase